MRTIIAFFARIETKNDGGVLALALNFLNPLLVNTYNASVEAVWFEFNVGIEKLLLGTIYRSLNCNMNEHNNILSEITLQCNTHIDHNICLYGDFNIPKIDWRIPCPLNNEQKATSSIDCLNNNALEQIINFNTRDDNILDLVLCRNMKYLTIANIAYSLVNSDHECIKLIIEMDNTNNTDHKLRKYKYNFRKADYKSLSKYLSSINWFLSLSQCLDNNTCWETFKNILQKGIRENVPMTCQNKHNKRNFLPNYIKICYIKK